MTKFETQEIFFYKFLIHHLMKCRSFCSIDVSIIQKLHLDSSQYRLSFYLSTIDLKSHSLFLAPTHDFLFKQDWKYLTTLTNSLQSKMTLMAHQNYSTHKRVLIDRKILSFSENLFFAQFYEKHYDPNTDKVSIKIEKNNFNYINYQDKKDNIFLNSIDESLFSAYEHKKFNAHIEQKEIKKIKKL